MGERGPEGVGKAMTICLGAGMVHMGSYWVEFETYEATLRTPKIDRWPEGARRVGNAMTIGRGAGMVQMGSYWVEYEIDEASLRPLQIYMWPEGA